MFTIQVDFESAFSTSSQACDVILTPSIKITSDATLLNDEVVLPVTSSAALLQRPLASNGSSSSGDDEVISIMPAHEIEMDPPPVQFSTSPPTHVHRPRRSSSPPDTKIFSTVEIPDSMSTMLMQGQSGECKIWTSPTCPATSTASLLRQGKISFIKKGSLLSRCHFNDPLTRCHFKNLFYIINRCSQLLEYFNYMGL